MKNIAFGLIFAFLLSIIVHYFSFIYIDKTIKNQKLTFPTKNKQTNKKQGYTSIKYVKLIKPQKKTPEKTKEIKKTVPKKTDKIIKKKELIKKTVPKKNIVKKIAPIKTIEIPKEKTIDLKELFTIKKEDQTTKEKLRKEELEVKTKTARENEIKEIQRLDPLTQQYIKLYGEEFFSYSNIQKKFIKNNINKIGKVTQRYLEYPRVSIRTRQSGINVVEFILHPNGDITNLMLIDSSGYTALDSNSVDTIKIAYKDYPKPLEAVKIKIYISYKLR